MASTTIIEPMPDDLIHEPLEWLFAEHYRHRQLWGVIERIAASTVLLREEVAEVLNFLRLDLPLHMIDEEEDLFPLLRRRCEPADEVEKVLGVLSLEHSADIDAAERVGGHLERALATGVAPGLDPAARKALTDFVMQEKRHIALENGVVLPIARLRLEPADLRTLSRRLAARRGRVLQDEGRD